MGEGQLQDEKNRKNNNGDEVYESKIRSTSFCTRRFEKISNENGEKKKHTHKMNFVKQMNQKTENI